MTSSLVGSEMCIRDSVSTGPSEHDNRANMPGLDHLVVPPPGHRPTASSVSYTHLTLPTICSV
eukprot:12150963-Prorocentrum_lima.AAC.1